MYTRFLHSIAKAQVTLAVAGFVIGALFWIPAISFYKRAQLTTGNVTGLKMQDKMFAPTFSFKDSKGVEHRIESYLYSNPPSYAVGQSVLVRFVQEDPGSARLDTFWDLWAIPVIIQGVCIVVFVFSLIGLQALKRFAPIFS